MHFLFPLLQLSLLLTLAEAFCLPLEPCPKHNQPITWTTCAKDITKTLDIECASIHVPLDYSDTTSEATNELALQRIRAVNAPSKGSILLNYGGAGIDGASGISFLGALQMNVTGGGHDLIAFDPRGTGNSTLRFSCFNITDERKTKSNENFVTFNSSDSAPGETWARAQLLATRCGTTQKQIGELIGSAFTARDMMRVVDALDEDGMLRFWGISYGTVLGATAAAMFPERMDAILLDGVVNVQDQFRGIGASRSPETFADADAVLDMFFDGCASNPSRCPLARNRTSLQLKDAYFAFLNHVKFNPLPLPSFNRLLDYATVKAMVLNNLYTPTEWDSFSVVLDAMLTNVTLFEEHAALQFGILRVGRDTESWLGIECSDSVFRSDNLEDAISASKERTNVSVFGDHFDFITSACAQWPFHAKERYKGDFRVQTRKPVLLIGNTADPVTPLVSARNVSAGFEGSVVLQQDGSGHGALAQVSSCTSKAIEAYFSNGTLPHPGSICPVDVPAFTS